MAYIQLNGQIFGGKKCKGKVNVEINFDYAFFSREYKNKTRHLCTPITRSISGKGSPKILSKSMLKWWRVPKINSLSSRSGIHVKRPIPSSQFPLQWLLTLFTPRRRTRMCHQRSNIALANPMRCNRSSIMLPVFIPKSKTPKLFFILKPPAFPCLPGSTFPKPENSTVSLLFSRDKTNLKALLT